MAISIKDPTYASRKAKVGPGGALLVHRVGADVDSDGGRYIHTHQTGALTAIAAVTSSAGHLWAFRNATSDTSRLCLIERVFATLTGTVGASTAQEVGLALYRTTSHTVQPTGGTAATLTTPQTKLRTSHAVPQATIYGEDTTGALTAGTYTMDTVPLMVSTEWCLAASAAVPIPKVRLDLDLSLSPLVLAKDEGLLLANQILMANSFAAKLAVTVIWREVPGYQQ